MAWHFRLALVSSFVASVALAQVDRPNLNGTVTDASGAVVPLANVEVVSRGTGLKKSCPNPSRRSLQHFRPPHL